jgi:hypothetical protein
LKNNSKIIKKSVDTVKQTLFCLSYQGRDCLRLNLKTKENTMKTRENLLDELYSICPNSWAIWTDGSCDDETDETLAETIADIKANM